MNHYKLELLRWRNIFSLSVVIMLLFIGSCKKESHLFEQPDQKSITDLKSWFDNNKSLQGGFLSAIEPDWNKVLQKQEDGVTVFEVSCNNTKNIINGIRGTDATNDKKEASGNQTRVKLLLFDEPNKPLSGAYMFLNGNNSGAAENHYKSLPTFTGNVMYYNLENRFTNGYEYVNGKVVKGINIAPKETTNTQLLNLGTEKGNTNSNKGKVMLAQADCTISTWDVYQEQCIIIEPVQSIGGGNGKLAVAGGYTNCRWEYIGSFETTSCSSSGGDGGYNPSSGSTPPSGGGGGTNEPTITSNDLENAIFFDNGKPKIADIKKYIDCFKDGKTAQSYTMTIYADQPVAGKSDWFKVVTPGVSTNNPFNVPTGIVWTRPDGTFFDVGHTFVTFEKNNTDGTNVRQTLGFYPKGNTFNSEGAMENNSGHNADVSYTMNVTKAQFEAGLQKVENDFANKRYVLFGIGEYNCTDAAISWMNAAGASFGNSTSGLFTNTPGDFGQILRSLPNSIVGSMAGIQGKGPCN